MLKANHCLLFLLFFSISAYALEIRKGRVLKQNDSIFINAYAFNGNADINEQADIPYHFDVIITNNTDEARQYAYTLTLCADIYHHSARCVNARKEILLEPKAQFTEEPKSLLLTVKYDKSGTYRTQASILIESINEKLRSQSSGMMTIAGDKEINQVIKKDDDDRHKSDDKFADAWINISKVKAGSAIKFENRHYINIINQTSQTKNYMYVFTVCGVDDQEYEQCNEMRNYVELEQGGGFDDDSRPPLVLRYNQPGEYHIYASTEIYGPNGGLWRSLATGYMIVQ
jgi:hypothetical protein